MLIRFFLKRLYQQFFICSALITMLLAASNIFVRLPGIMSLRVIPMLCMVMLPLVAIFAIPIASSLAVQNVIGNLLINDELLFISLNRRARTALYKAVLIFSFSLVAVYMPLVFFWAPQSYSRGKQMLVSFAYEQLMHLEAQTFHSLVDGMTVYFASKTNSANSLHVNDQEAINNNETYFNNIFLALSSKNRDRYFLTAKQGRLTTNYLIMEQGSLLLIKGQHSYSAQFSGVHIDLKQLWNVDQKDFVTKDIKFHTLPQLVQCMDTQLPPYLEFHKRLAQLLWQLVLPFLALFLVLMFGQRKSNMLLGIITSGMLFFVQYMALTLAQVMQSSTFLALSLLYIPPVIFTIFLAYKARRT